MDNGYNSQKAFVRIMVTLSLSDLALFLTLEWTYF